MKKEKDNLKHIKIKKMKPFGIIYSIKNKVNGKYYIGQTTRGFDKRYGKRGGKCDIERVLNTHKHELNRKDNHGSGNKKLVKDIEKYGFDAFEVNKKLAKAYSREELDRLEIFYIEKYDSVNNGYNRDYGGQYKKSGKFNNIKSNTLKKFYKKIHKLAKKGDDEAIEFIKQFKEKHSVAQKERYKYLRKRISEGDKKALSDFRKLHPSSKAVKCITTGKIFYSAAEAARYYNIDPSSLLKAAKHNQRNYAGTYKGERLEWEFI